MPIHAPFWGEVGAHFFRMMSLIVQTPKRTVLGLNHVIWAIMREYRSRGSSWACERGKRTGQEKGQKGLYFTYLWRSPHWCDVHEKFLVGDVFDLITYAKFQNEIFRGYFTGGRIFHFPIYFWMGLTTVQRYYAACEGYKFGTAGPIWTIFRSYEPERLVLTNGVTQECLACRQPELSQSAR